MQRLLRVALLVSLSLAVAGCPKGGGDFKAGKKAERLQDYDTALVHYERALRADPDNVEYRLKATRMRFETGQFHVRQGQKHREAGQLRLALAEFQKALAIDPSSPIAEQEIKATLEMIAAAEAPAQAQPQPEAEPEEVELLDKPPQLEPLSRDPINLKLTNDARIVYETIGKLAGLTVIVDPDFQARRIPIELTNVTLEQALDVVALASKSFWQPVTPHIIFVSTDTPQKRQEYEEYIIRTFYLSNTITPQDVTEIATGVRQLLDLRRLQQVNSQNALIVRDTPDKVAALEYLLGRVDKAKPEVVIQVSVLQARRDRARDLGILPASSTVLTPVPRNPVSEDGADIRLNELQRLSTADYALTLPGASATALITDSTTKIIQNPEIRTVDGQTAKLRVGDRVPIATGSFQAGVGVGVGTGTTGGIVNPLVNTQFQFTDVGVNIDVTPRIHENDEVSMKVLVEVSSVSGRVSIGGIDQPIISQRKIEHDVRLKEGEVSILGGLIERSETRSIQGWPLLSRIPILRYLFSSEGVDKLETEVLIVLTPRIIRRPVITAKDARGLATGSQSVIRVRPAELYEIPPAPQQTRPPTTAPQQQPQAPPQAQPPAAQPPTDPAQPARLRFEPQVMTVRTGETLIVSVLVDNARDLFSVPLLLQFDPKVITVEEVRHGDFLSGGTQEIAIVHRTDAERGQAVISAMRQPNTSGVSGSGTLFGLVVRAVGPGSSTLQVVQVNARDSAQRPLPVVTGEATIRVE